jgi:hypothetical protein
MAADLRLLADGNSIDRIATLPQPERIVETKRMVPDTCVNRKPPNQVCRTKATGAALEKFSSFFS